MCTIIVNQFVSMQRTKIKKNQTEINLSSKIESFLIKLCVVAKFNMICLDISKEHRVRSQSKLISPSLCYLKMKV